MRSTRFVWFIGMLVICMVCSVSGYAASAPETEEQEFSAAPDTESNMSFGFDLSNRDNQSAWFTGSAASAATLEANKSGTYVGGNFVNEFTDMIGVNTSAAGSCTVNESYIVGEHAITRQTNSSSQSEYGYSSIDDEIINAETTQTVNETDMLAGSANASCSADSDGYAGTASQSTAQAFYDVDAESSEEGVYLYTFGLSAQNQHNNESTMNSPVDANASNASTVGYSESEEWTEGGSDTDGYASAATINTIDGAENDFSSIAQTIGGNSGTDIEIPQSCSSAAVSAYDGGDDEFNNIASVNHSIAGSDSDVAVDAPASASVAGLNADAGYENGSNNADAWAELSLKDYPNPDAEAFSITNPTAYDAATFAATGEGDMGDAYIEGFGAVAQTSSETTRGSVDTITTDMALAGDNDVGYMADEGSFEVGEYMWGGIGANMTDITDETMTSGSASATGNTMFDIRFSTEGDEGALFDGEGGGSVGLGHNQQTRDGIMNASAAVSVIPVSDYFVPQEFPEYYGEGYYPPSTVIATGSLNGQYMGYQDDSYVDIAKTGSFGVVGESNNVAETFRNLVGVATEYEGATNPVEAIPTNISALPKVFGMVDFAIATAGADMSKAMEPELNRDGQPTVSTSLSNLVGAGHIDESELFDNPQWFGVGEGEDPLSAAISVSQDYRLDADANYLVTSQYWFESWSLFEGEGIVGAINAEVIITLNGQVLDAHIFDSTLEDETYASLIGILETGFTGNVGDLLTIDMALQSELYDLSMRDFFAASGLETTLLKTTNSPSFTLMRRNVTGDSFLPTQHPSENVIPEPSTMMLLGSGLMGLFGFRRKK